MLPKMSLICDKKVMKIQVFPLEIDSLKRIGVKPQGYHTEFPKWMRAIQGSRWTPNEKCWHIPYHSNAYKQLKQVFGNQQIEVLKHRPFKKKSQRNSSNINNELKSQNK